MIIACSTLMVSCDNWLEVKPYDQISEGELLKSEEGYQKMLNGIYIDLNSTALYGQSLSVEMIEVMGGAYTIGSDNSVWGNYKDLASYQYGGQLFNSSLFDKVENIGTADVYNNQDRRALYDRWSINNRNAQFKGISMVQKTDKSSRFVMDENTLTCESINLGYEFPLNIAKKFGMQALSVQANMNDIFRWSTVKAERGIDYPFARTVSFSIGATF